MGESETVSIGVSRSHAFGSQPTLGWGENFPHPAQEEGSLANLLVISSMPSPLTLHRLLRHSLLSVRSLHLFNVASCRGR